MAQWFPDLMRPLTAAQFYSVQMNLYDRDLGEDALTQRIAHHPMNGMAFAPQAELQLVIWAALSVATVTVVLTASASGIANIATHCAWGNPTDDAVAHSYDSVSCRRWRGFHRPFRKR